MIMKPLLEIDQAFRRPHTDLVHLPDAVFHGTVIIVVSVHPPACTSCGHAAICFYRRTAKLPEDLKTMEIADPEPSGSSESNGSALGSSTLDWNRAAVSVVSVCTVVIDEATLRSAKSVSWLSGI